MHLFGLCRKLILPRFNTVCKKKRSSYFDTDRARGGGERSAASGRDGGRACSAVPTAGDFLTEESHQRPPRAAALGLLPAHLRRCGGGLIGHTHHSDVPRCRYRSVAGKVVALYGWGNGNAFSAENIFAIDSQRQRGKKDAIGMPRKICAHFVKSAKGGIGGNCPPEELWLLSFLGK